MALSRRSFLQTLGLTLVSLGAIDCISSDVCQYAQALTRFEGRKFALLIGIDHYPNVPSLTGCLLDLKVQQNLLVQRFGFAADDIFLLQDQQASRDNILTAFQKELKDLVQPNDLLLVHFSGYGTRIQNEEGLTAAIVPADGVIAGQKVNINNAIAVETVVEFMQSLNPAQMVLVLDTSFDPVATGDRPYWHGRTYPKPFTVGLNPSAMATEEEVQRNLLQRGSGRQQVLRLTAATTGWAAEGQVNGVGTGLFTAALARYLWAIQPLATMSDSEAFLATQYRRQYGNRQGLQLSAPKTAELYGLLPTSTTPAVGNVVAQTGNVADVFLGGFDLEILQAIALGGEFQTLEQTPITLQLSSKTGLFGQVKTTQTVPAVGTSFQEIRRFFPRNLALKIALGNNLSRIERVDATSALVGLTGVVNISAPQEWADYVFDESYQLFTATGKLLPGLPPMAENQAVKSSVNQLQPSLERLLAIKWLRLLMNETSSQVPLTIALNRAGKTTISLTEGTTVFNPERSPSFQQPTVKSGESLFYRLSYSGTKLLYCFGFALSPKQELFLLTSAAGMIISPEKTSVDLPVASQRASGAWTNYWIAGDRPLVNFQAQLAKRVVDLDATFQKLGNPLPLIQALLTDLQEITPSGNEGNKDLYVLSMQNWAGVQLSYDIAEATAPIS